MAVRHRNSGRSPGVHARRRFYPTVAVALKKV